MNFIKINMKTWCLMGMNIIDKINRLGYFQKIDITIDM